MNFLVRGCEQDGVATAIVELVESRDHRAEIFWPTEAAGGATMDTLIALIRNGACVVKDVAPATHWVMAPVYGPITMIEAVIAPTQFAAVYLTLVAAVPALVSSCYLWCTSSAPSDEQWAQAIAATSTSSPLAVALAEASLAAHTASARQGVTVSVCKLVIGFHC